jgi:hypothetical protein
VTLAAVCSVNRSLFLTLALTTLDFLPVHRHHSEIANHQSSRQLLESQPDERQIIASASDDWTFHLIHVLTKAERDTPSRCFPEPRPCALSGPRAFLHRLSLGHGHYLPPRSHHHSHQEHSHQVISLGKAHLRLHERLQRVLRLLLLHQKQPRDLLLPMHHSRHRLKVNRRLQLQRRFRICELDLQMLRRRSLQCKDRVRREI